MEEEEEAGKGCWKRRRRLGGVPGVPQPEPEPDAGTDVGCAGVARLGVGGTRTLRVLGAVS